MGDQQTDMEVLNLEWGAFRDRGVPVPLLELDPAFHLLDWGSFRATKLPGLAKSEAQFLSLLPL